MSLAVLPVSALFDDRNLTEPEEFFTSLRSESPIAAVPGTSFFVVSTWSLVLEAVERTDDFSSNLHAILVRGTDGAISSMDMAAEAVEQVLAIADDPDHHVHRTAVRGALTRQVRRIGEVVDATCAELWAAMEERVVSGELRVDWASDFADQLPVRVIARVIGVPEEELDEVLVLTYRVAELLGGVVPHEHLERVLNAPFEMLTILQRHFHRALAEAGDDLNGDLARAVLAGQIAEGTALSILLQAINAGSESTASAIGNAARLLAEDPELAERLRRDPSSIDRFVEESLRIRSPFRGHYRHVKRDTYLGGVLLPAGSNLFLLWASANLDEEHFSNARAIDLDRPGIRQHLAFGRGAHFCVGSALARLEAGAALKLLLQRTSAIRLDPQRPPQWMPSVMMRRHTRLPLVLDLPGTDGGSK